MILIVRLSGKLCGVNMDGTDYHELAEIYTLVEEGNPVIIVESLENLESLGITDEVTMVKRD